MIIHGLFFALLFQIWILGADVAKEGLFLRVIRFHLWGAGPYIKDLFSV